MIDIIDMSEGCFQIKINNQLFGSIQTYSNPYHSTYTYLSINLVAYPKELASRIFCLLTEKVNRGFQVMIASNQLDEIAFLTSAGFICKRKCYEIEVQQTDFATQEELPNLLIASKDSKPFQTCAHLQLEHYKKCHQAISPWTASEQEFLLSLPETVYYEEEGGNILACAFLDKEEIAYVYGKDTQTFQAFLPKLLYHAFKRYPRLTFEVDDCDEIAMELGKPFIHPTTESWNTYILPSIQGSC